MTEYFGRSDRDPILAGRRPGEWSDEEWLDPIRSVLRFTLAEGEDVTDIVTGAVAVGHRRAGIRSTQFWIGADVPYVLAVHSWWPFKVEVDSASWTSLRRARWRLFQGVARDQGRLAALVEGYPQELLALTFSELDTYLLANPGRVISLLSRHPLLSHDDLEGEAVSEDDDVDEGTRFRNTESF